MNNKLITARKGYRKNLFDEGGSTGLSLLGLNLSYNLFGSNSNPFGVSLTAPASSMYVNLSNPTLRALAIGLSAALVNNFRLASANLYMLNYDGDALKSPLSFKEAFSKEGLNKGLKAGAGTALSAGAGLIGSLADNAISGGLSSAAGSAISGIGSTVGGAVGAVNPALGAVISVGSLIVGGLTNRAFGTKVNQAALNQANSDIASLRGFTSNANSMDDIKGPTATANIGSVYEGGWFSSGSAGRKNQRLRESLADARAFANRSVSNNINNLTDDLMNNALANYSAFGGFIDSVDPSTAIGYSMYTDKFVKDKLKSDNGMTNLFSGVPSTMFDIGGVLLTKGSTFGNITYISAGGTHEENPYDGILIGVDLNSVPNLVEENEVIYNDYVYSNRLTVPDFKKQYKNKKEAPYEALVLWNYSGKTFADAAKKIEKSTGSDERSEDNIANRGLEAGLQVLAGVQEKEREKEKLREQLEAIDNMTPEEFAAMQLQLEAQQLLQEAMQLEAEQQAMQGQPTDEELAMMLQLASQELMMQLQLVQPPMAAYGGEINRFDNGGYTKKVDVSDGATEAEIIKALRKAGYAKYYKDWATKLNGSNNKRSDFVNFINNEVNRNNIRSYIKSLSPAARKYLARKNNVLLEKTNDENTDAFIDKLANVFETPNAVKEAYDAAYNLPLLNREAEGAVIPEYAQVAETKTTKWKELPKDYKKDLIGETDGKYKLDDDNKYFLDDEGNRKTADLVENEAKYNKWTKYVLGLKDDDKELIDTLKWYDKNRPDNINSRFFDKDGNLRTDWRDTFKTIRKGDLGAGHYSPDEEEIVNKSRVRYMLGDLEINAEKYLKDGKWDNPMFNIDNGTITDDNGTLLTTYKLTRNPEYKDEGNPDDASKTTGNNDNFPTAPTWPYLAGIGLQGVSTLYNALTPIDYSNADAMLKAALNAGNYKPVEFKPIGNYLRYNPMDIWYEQNRLNANARATDRAIMNSGANQGAKDASLLANAYGNLIASGNLYRQALEYNDALRKQVEDFNRGTNLFNSEGFLKADMANQSAANQARGYTLEGTKAGLAMRQALEDAKGNAINAGINGFASSLFNYALDRYNLNVIDWMLAHNLNPISLVKNSKYATKAKGGKVRKRNRGLGF